MIELEIAGDPGLSFSGDCSITIGKLPEKRYRIQGEAPAKYWLPGDAIRCSLAKTGISGRLIARISRHGVVEIQQATIPPLRWVGIASSGPWGKAKGTASAARPLWQ